MKHDGVGMRVTVWTDAQTKASYFKSAPGADWTKQTASGLAIRPDVLGTAATSKL
jgi:hypothetical protein